MVRKTGFILVFLITLIVGIHSAADDEHFCLGPGEVFKGHRHYTEDGDTCLFWKNIPGLSPDDFPDATLEAAENNCRDPTTNGTKRGQPWCYISSNPQREGLCDIPKCNDRESVFMSVIECGAPRIRAGYKNGDVIPIYSDKWSDKTESIAYPGCALRFEACKECKFHLKVDAELPTCNTQPVGNTCVEGCQMLSVRDGLYNSTIASVYTGTVVAMENFHTVSNVLIVNYCQRVNTFKQRPASYRITAFVTTKHIHQTAPSGEIQSPNFPNGYFSEKETYVYSVDPPVAQLDSNITLLFYDWDLNGSAGSTIMIKWTEKLHNGSSAQMSREFSATDWRPALFIPSSSFYLVFDTGRLNTEYTQEEIGFTAKYNHVRKSNWPEQPNTQCGRYFPRSGSIGGTLTYSLFSSDVSSYIDCIWVIPIPKGYTHLRYTVQLFNADRTVGLVIRDGVTSSGRVLSADQGTEYIVDGRGLFVHVAGRHTNKNLKLNITYFATVKAYGHECNSNQRVLMFYCPPLDLCIDQELYITHAGPVCDIDTKPKPLECSEFKCADGKGCYTQITKCNMYKDCPDGSDEDVKVCYGAEPAPSVNVPLAVSLPIVAVLFLIPIIIIIVYIVRQRRDELKDEELQASKKQLVNGTGAAGGATGGPGGGGGVDNPGLQLDDIPLSMVQRSRPLSRPDAPNYPEPELNAPLKKPNPKFDEIRADIHQGKSPYTPRGPGETQSMRVEPQPQDPRRPTRSQRFDLPPDIDRIDEIPTEPYNRYNRQPSRDRPVDQSQRPTLGNYRFDERPYGEPEGRSYRDPEQFREPSYRGQRQPADGRDLPLSPKLQEQPIVKPISGTRPKLYQPRQQPQQYDPRYANTKSTLSQYRPDRDVPGGNKYNPRDSRQPQTTQSYRMEPEKYEPPPREARSYRFQGDHNALSASTEV